MKDKTTKNIVLLDAKTLGEFDRRIFERFGNFSAYGMTKRDEILSRAYDAHIIITNKVVLDKEILESLPHLELICISATGTNNVDLETAKRLNIEVKNVLNYSTSSVAQHTITIALAFLSNLDRYDVYCKSGEWSKCEVFTYFEEPIRELDSLNWGIIGFGNIGKRVASIASSFGASVSYFSTSGKNHNSNYPQKTLNELLKTSDIVSIHAPLNERTKNLINKENLGLLKEGAILINVGRGGIVNEEDITYELKARNFFFGTDVLEVEPMRANHPFLDKAIANKLIITPHIAWAYDGSMQRLLVQIQKNIEEFLK